MTEKGSADPPPAELAPPLSPEQQADLALGRAVRQMHAGGARVVVVTYDDDEPLVRGTTPPKRVKLAATAPLTIPTA